MHHPVPQRTATGAPITYAHSVKVGTSSSTQTNAIHVVLLVYPAHSAIMMGIFNVINAMKDSFCSKMDLQSYANHVPKSHTVSNVRAIHKTLILILGALHVNKVLTSKMDNASEDAISPFVFHVLIQLHNASNVNNLT